VMKPGDVLLTSLIRTAYLALLPAARFKGRIGSVTEARHKRLVSALATFLHNAA
jgi:hypothetical protein